MSAAVISGTFSDIKTIKTRSCIQLVIEVPIEQGEAVIKAFGFPQPGNEIHVAVARINPAAEARAAEKALPDVISSRPRSRAQMAGILCSDPVFRAFIRETYGLDVRDEDQAAEFVRDRCVASSRRDLDLSSLPAARWDAIYADWQSFKAMERVA